jgi:hypothetical protein
MWCAEIQNDYPTALAINPNNTQFAAGLSNGGILMCSVIPSKLKKQLLNLAFASRKPQSPANTLTMHDLIQIYEELLNCALEDNTWDAEFDTI